MYVCFLCCMLTMDAVSPNDMCDEAWVKNEGGGVYGEVHPNRHPALTWLVEGISLAST